MMSLKLLFRQKNMDHLIKILITNAGVKKYGFNLVDDNCKEFKIKNQQKNCQLYYLQFYSYNSME